MPESAYEKARRLANENSLPGVDWDSMRDPKYDTLPDTLKPEAFEAEKDKSRLQEHFKAVPGAKNPWGYIDRPGDYEQEEVSKARQQTSNIALKKPLPEGMEMTHTVHRGRSAVHEITLHDRKNEPYSETGKTHVGNLSWNGTSGHIGGLFVDEGYRHLVPNMLEAAHALSDAYGHVGPVKSNDLTSYSHKLAEKFAPSSIPDDAVVEGVPERVYSAIRKDPSYHASYQRVSDHINTLYDGVNDTRGSINWEHPAFEHLDYARDKLVSASYSHDYHDHYETTDHLDTMMDHLRDAHSALTDEERKSELGTRITKLHEEAMNARTAAGNL